MLTKVKKKYYKTKSKAVCYLTILTISIKAKLNKSDSQTHDY